MLNTGVLAEYDKYTYDRLYGSLKSDYLEGNRVVVLTPNGFRQVKQNCPNENIFTVLVRSNLGTRIKRYIDRCGVDKFDFNDKDEICNRTERDYGMFLWLELDVYLVVENNEGTDIGDVVK